VSGVNHRNEDLRRLEETSALGYLYNSVAHELNNHITNLLLAADQFSAAQSDRTLDLMVGQAQKMGEVVRRLQELGGSNMDRGTDRVALGELCEQLGSWLEELGMADQVRMEVSSPDAQLILNRSNVVRALCLLARWGEETHSGHPPEIKASLEELPRSAWAPAGETVTMAVIRLRRGDPPPEQNALLKAVVDDFFGTQRSKEDVELMAGWEIVRKLRGRLELCGGAGHGGVEWSIALPLPE